MPRMTATRPMTASAPTRLLALAFGWCGFPGFGAGLVAAALEALVGGRSG